MNPAPGSPDLVEPAGPIDPQVSIVSVQTPQGRPIALLANYSLHYVGGVGPGHVSADYFGAFADQVQQLLKADRLDPPFVGIMSNGTSGDINNINFRESRSGWTAYEAGTNRRRRAGRQEAGARGAIGVLQPVPSRSTPTPQGSASWACASPTPTRSRGPKRSSRPACRTGNEARLTRFTRAETRLLSQYPDQVEVTIQALADRQPWHRGDPLHGCLCEIRAGPEGARTRRSSRCSRSSNPWPTVTTTTPRTR